MLWLLESIDRVELAQLLPLLPRLSPGRRDRVRALGPERAKVQAILAERLLGRALEAEYGLSELPPMETGKKGKPFFPAHPALCFNLSHCNNAVACALDRAPLGVDVESFDRLRRDDSARRDGAQPSVSPAIFRVLSDLERAWVLAGTTPREQDRRFIMVWTCKEAYGKARGDGILYPLKDTAFVPQPEPWTQEGFVFTTLPQEEFCLSLCARGSLPLCRVSLRELGI